MYAQAASTLTTVRDLLRFAVTRFNQSQLAYGHGTQNAYDEAAYLILATLNLPINQLDPYLDAHLLPSEVQDVVDMIEHRVEERIPVAYLTRQAWQGDLSFYVDERVRVPRSFIFELLGAPLAAWIEPNASVHRALDLCTGSGSLAIQLALHYPEAEIDAVDISLDALEVAAINVESYELGDRINLIHTDLFEGLADHYDLIISSPPYIDSQSVEALPEEFQHEPTLALESGQDGLDATREILRRAAAFLNPHGVLLVEIGHNREALETAYPQLPFTWMDTQSGDSDAFLLTREELISAELN